MRLRALAFAGIAFPLAAFGAWEAGERVATWAETRAETALAAALAEAGFDWAEARADGLRIRLGGEAPDETARFRAVEIARHAAEFGHVVDAITVARADPAERPAFALEVLRSGAEVSLIGLVPASAREMIAARLAASGIGATVTDMLEVVDHPAPAGWEDALAFGLDALADLPRAQIGVAEGAVRIAATADDDTSRTALERRLEGAAPDGIGLTLDIGAPRPVITPYALAFRRDADGTARLASCSAETAAEAEAILAAARQAGADAIECRIGIGAPSPDWAAAAGAGIAAVAALDAGSFALTDLDAFLAVPPDIAPEDLAAAAAALTRDLPPPFTLEARASAPLADDAGEPGAAPVFRAALAPDGSVSLSGPLADPTARIAVTGFARSIYGYERVIDATVLHDGLPEGWVGRVLVGVEALALVEEGELTVSAEGLTLAGRSLQDAAAAEIEAFIGDRAGGMLLVDVAFDAEAAAALEAEREEAERRARDERCAASVKALLAEEMILFEPGSASIEDDSADIVASIGRELASCPGARFEVAGHTDAQGSRELNQRLSEERARAVVAALAAGGVELVPVGHGPDRPVADNDTAEGRALNRRIEFALLRDEPGAAPAAPDVTVRPVLGDPAPGDAAALVEEVVEEGADGPD